MKRIFFILTALCASILASAQVRTYSDNASGTFIIGLDSYFYGESGDLNFTAGGTSWQASVNSGAVSINGTPLPDGWADVVVGIHDFTDNRIPELVVARRDGENLDISVYTLQAGEWIPIGRMESSGAKEARIFRQVISIRRGQVLQSWTCHGQQFDYKSSEGR